MFSSLFFLSYLMLYEPMEAYHYDLTAIVNEYVLLFSFYYCLLFTDYVPEPETRYMFGQNFLILLYVDLALNLLALVYEIFRQVFITCRRKRMKRKVLQAHRRKL